MLCPVNASVRLHYTPAAKDSSRNNLPYLFLPYMIPTIKAEYLAVCNTKGVMLVAMNENRGEKNKPQSEPK